MSIMVSIITLLHYMSLLTSLDSHVSPRKNPAVVVTQAAYLLFYRRRSDHPLGGKVLEEIVSAAHTAVDSDSQPGSRSESPSGEGQRLGGSSRNGSSSALLGAGVAHQPGDGGSEGEELETFIGPRARNDELPAYSIDPVSGEQTLDMAETIEGMNIDLDDEGIGGMCDVSYGPSFSMHYEQPGWGFDRLPNNQVPHAPAGSMENGNDNDGEEGLFVGSDGHASMASNMSDANLRIQQDFGDQADIGTIDGHGFDSTPMRNNSPVMEVVPPPSIEGDDEEIPVVELHPASL
jgi:ubiquitin carboxyl-terminal hydrolase 4/11